MDEETRKHIAAKQRHRFFQLCITIGVFVSTFVGYFFPYHGEFAVAAGVATNLIWIWEQ